MNNIQHIQRKQQSQKITLIGAILNVVLAIIKIIAGMLGSSSALVADGIHSFSDLISDFIIYWSATHSSSAPDAEHPYGHGRFETLATLGLGVVLALVGLWIVYDGIINFYQNQTLHYGSLLISVAIISIVSKEFLYQATMRVAKKINSKMLEANAWHHRLDSLSSIVVLIGVVGTLGGYPYLDNIASIIIGGMVGHIAWDLVKDSVAELVDSAIDSKDIKKLTTAISQVSGVCSVHMLRTRKIGNTIIVDTHIQVAPLLSVSEGHMISVYVENVAKKCLHNISEIMVHIDPEDDEHMNLSSNLPSREQVLQTLKNTLSNAQCASNIIDIRLHYLDGKINSDIYLPLICLEQYTHKDIYNSLSAKIHNLPHFNKVKIFYSSSL